jgi:hypothetical protein
MPKGKLQIGGEWVGTVGATLINRIFFFFF